ncbi:hypothetical protein GCM10007919_23870 [Rhizobium indigoferae]|nr:hypothetical protein GCM10007919_23870 [Rhizobium indigoferae]
MQADAKHQKNDAHLGELAGKGGIGDKARRERPHQDARHQVTDQWRQPKPVGGIAQDRRENETDGDRRDKSYFLMHVRPLW